MTRSIRNEREYISWTAFRQAFPGTMAYWRYCICWFIALPSGVTSCQSKCRIAVVFRYTVVRRQLLTRVRSTRCKVLQNCTSLHCKTQSGGMVRCGNSSRGQVVSTPRQVPSARKCRNLGVIFDCAMKMKDHISMIWRSSFYQLRNIGTVRKYLTEDAWARNNSE